MTLQVSMVPHEYVMQVWPDVEGYMESAAQETHGRYEAQDILDLVLDYSYPLWIAFDETGIKGAVVSGFNQYPRKKYLNLMFCGGDDGFSWKDDMRSILQKWATDNGCDGIEATGRFGWAKIFKHDGFKPVWQVFELPVAETGLGVANG